MYLLGAGQCHQSGNCFRNSSDIHTKNQILTYESPSVTVLPLPKVWERDCGQIHWRLNWGIRTEKNLPGWIFLSFSLSSVPIQLFWKWFLNRSLCSVCFISPLGSVLNVWNCKLLYVCWFGSFYVFLSHPPLFFATLASSEMQDLVVGQRWTLSLHCFLAKSGLKLGQFSS